MKNLLVAFAMLLIGSSAFAAREDGPAGKLTSRTNDSAAKQCGKAAGDRKGGEHKAFIEGCLSSSRANKSKTCAEKAKESGKRGDELDLFKRKCRLGHMGRKSDGSSDH
jgi:hypothetical protein